MLYPKGRIGKKKVAQILGIYPKMKDSKVWGKVVGTHGIKRNKECLGKCCFCKEVARSDELHKHRGWLAVDHRACSTRTASLLLKSQARSTAPAVVFLKERVLAMETLKAVATVVTILAWRCVLGAQAATPEAGAAAEMVMPHYPFYWIKVHGWLMWLGMGLLMPVAIVLVRFSRSARDRGDLKTVRTLVYAHIVIQTVAVLAVICSAVVGIVKFDNSFGYTHERLGLALWILVWLAPLVGLVRPHHGARTRPIWYSLHWLFGTAGVVLGFYNIYTGLHAYEQMKHTSLRTLQILFSIQLSLVALVYLTQDRWGYLKQQGTFSKTVTPISKGERTKDVPEPAATV